MQFAIFTGFFMTLSAAFVFVLIALKMR